MGDFKLVALVFGIVIFLVCPTFVLATNDISIDEAVDFELLTSDTAVSTTVIASAGGQVTDLDVESNYIDITLDNSSTIIFNTTVSGQYLKLTKQSGSSDYSISPSCPTTTATLTGTGSVVVLRLEVLTTNTCPINSGGGGGIALSSPTNLSIKINNGATETTSNNVVLNLTASNASQMAISNQANFAGSSWETYTATKYWTLLTGEGSRTVYVKFGGPNSATSSVYSAVIKVVKTLSIPVVETPTPPISTGTYTFNADLEFGMNNNDVRQLQIILKAQGYLTAEPNGNFGYQTLTAVKAYQKANGLSVTGFVGPLTRAVLNGTKTSTVTPTIPTTPVVTPTVCNVYMTKYIKLGEQNDPAEVRKLQKFLKDYEGFSELVETGIYDEETFEAVKIFQARYQSEILGPWNTNNPTGYVYTTTLKKINAIYCQQTQGTAIVGSSTLAQRLVGNMLLRVEAGGAIGYVDPRNLLTYQVTWLNARHLFETRALGINELDHAKIRMVGQTTAINSITQRLKGYLLLRTEAGGAITYVDMKGYGHNITFTNLIPLFESTALGITEDNYAKLPVGGVE